jgi:ADP-ribosylglycohydrolase
MINRYKNSILLSAIGDSLGWITEFEKSKDSINTKYGNNEITSFQDWEKYVGGRFNGYLDKIKKGAYSDDTQLLLAVARAINENGRVDNVYFSKIELAYWLSYARGAGRTIKNAARKISRKSADWNNNFFVFSAGKTKIDYRESGANGAAMRILPIALANRGNPDIIKEEIFSNSIITHGHPRAIVGAILYGFAVDKMLQQNLQDFSFKDYLTDLGSKIQEQFNTSFLSNSKYTNWLHKWNSESSLDFLTLYDETVNEVLEALRSVYLNIKNNSNDTDALSEFGCFDPKTKGSGVATVIAGIYLAIKYYNNPKEAIIKSVNAIGSDTDSIAAFAGGLCGALYEDNCVPSEWSHVQDEMYLLNVAEDLYSISNGNFEKINKQEVFFEIKSLNEIKSDTYQLNERITFNPFGEGVIIKIDRQKTLTSGKYNLILDVAFNFGQSCKFSKILDIKSNNAESFFEN